MGISASEASGTPKLRRALGLWDLILYGLIVIQPTAPMPVYGVMSMRSHGYAVVTILLAMVAMLFTAISYGKMASAYPSAGSAFTYVGREIHPALGYLTGWSMAMDYMLNPLICTILCSKFAMNFLPDIPYTVWVVTFATLITVLNLQGIKTSARINSGLVVVMCVVIVLFLAAAQSGTLLAQYQKYDGKEVLTIQFDPVEQPLDPSELYEILPLKIHQPLGMAFGVFMVIPAYIIPLVFPSLALTIDLLLASAIAVLSLTLYLSSSRLISREKLLP